MRALIVGDGYSRAGLAGARALAAAGWYVGIGVPGARGPLASSRAVRRSHDVPSPSTDSRSFVDAVSRAIADGHYEVVFATGDAEVVTLSADRKRLGATFPYAEHEVVLASFDKLKLYEAARASGLSIPRTEPIDRRREFPLPYVVKPRLHEPMGVSERIEATVVVDAAVGDEAVRHAAPTELLVQEMVRGKLMAYTVVCDRGGRTVARVQQVAEVVYPQPAGISARAHTVSIDEGLAAKVEGFLTAFGWFGLAELQFLVDGSGTAQLIDMNGRFYGSMSLATAAGANLPATWAALAMDREPVGVTASAGVGYQWLEGDLRSAAAAPKPVSAVLSTLASSPRLAHGIWSVRDPSPAVRFGAHLFARGVRKLLR